MDNRRLEDKVDKILDQIGEINVTTGKQQVSLDIHIKRTEILEAQIEPIKKHVAMVNGALKLIGVLALLAGIAEAVMKALGR